MSVTDATMTVTTHANFIPELWSNEVVEAIEYGIVITKRVNRDYERELMSLGDTLHIPYQSNYQVTTKSSGVSNTISFEAITEGKTDVTVSTQEYSAFLVEHVLEVQAMDGVRNRQTKKLGYALARGMEVSLAALPQNFSVVKGTYGVEISEGTLYDTLQSLVDAGAMEYGGMANDVSLIISSGAYIGLLKQELVKNRDYAGDGNAIRRAEVGNLLGMQVFCSQLLRVPSAGQHDSFAMHRDQIVLVEQKKPTTESQFLIRNLADGVVSWHLYGSAELDRPPETSGGGTAVDNFGVLVKSN